MKDRYDIGQDISELVCKSSEPLEEIKYLLLVLKQNGFRTLDTETINLELEVEEIDLMVHNP